MPIIITSPDFYNIKILKIYVAYLRDELHWTQDQVEQLFERSGTDIGILEYDDNWFNQELADKFHENVCSMTGDNDIAYKVGQYSTHQTAKGVAGRVLTGLLSPAVAYRNIAKISEEYSKGAIMTADQISRSHALIRAVPSPYCEEKSYQCRNRLGILESIPTFFNLPKATIEHTKCFHRGDDSCEYRVAWIDRPYRLIPYLSILLFFILLPSIYFYTNSMSEAVLPSLGLSGLLYAVFHQLSSIRLHKAFNEQIEALRISHETLERRHKESSLVSEINLYVNRMMTIERLCEVVTLAIHEKMGYDRVTIFLYDPDTNLLHPASYIGFNDTDSAYLKNAAFKVRSDNTGGVLVAVMNTGEPVFVRNMDKVIDNLSDRSQDFIHKLNVKSFAAVPIKFENVIFGVLAVDNVTPAKLLSEKDKQLLESVSMPIGVSFSNAKAYERLQNSKNLLEDMVNERTQDLIAARDDAVRANKAKSMFLANMSHELRTPLNAIMGFSQLIHMEAGEINNPQIETDSEKVINSSKHLLSLISDLLDMSKIEAGKMDLFVDDVDMQSMLMDVNNIASELSRTNRNRYKLIVDTDLKRIQTDEKKLKQILLNLISNACKFTSDGKITLTISSFYNERNYMTFEVQDTGIGIPEDKQSILFQDFSQTDSSISKKYGGTGLGLSLSRKFCEIIGGTIEVHSKQGVGTTFRVVIPAEYYIEKKKAP